MGLGGGVEEKRGQVGRKKREERGWKRDRGVEEGERRDRKGEGEEEGGRVTCSKSLRGGTGCVGSGCLQILQTLSPNLHQCL